MTVISAEGAMPGRSAAVIGVLLIVLGACSAHAQTAVEKARLARVMWSAFQCGTFAQMGDNSQEQARLFEVGIRAGREFLEAWKNQQIPRDVANREVPIGVGMLLQGPSPDFILGRIFENAMGDAFDLIVKKDNSGLPLEIPKWLNDPELRKMKAQTHYQKGNCVLVK